MSVYHKSSVSLNKDNDVSKDIKILGQGTYGCVIPKVIKCSKSKGNSELINKSTTQVSKLLLSEESFYKEINNTKYVNKYDNGRTSIVIDDICILTKEDIDNILLTNGIDKKYLEKCSDMQLTLADSIYQIIYNKRGISIKDQFKQHTKIPLLNFLKMTFNLFKGIKLFNKINFIHFDIYDKNILYLADENKLIFIDFGLSSKYSTFLTKKTLQYYGDSAKYYYPPEILAFSYFYKVSTDTYHNLFKRFKTDYEQELILIFDNDIINKIILYNYNNNYKLYLNDLANLFDLFYYCKDPYFILKKFLNKIDIYSLGIVLYQYIKLYKIHNNFITNIYKHILFPCFIINPYNRIPINKVLYLYSKNIL